ncbi:MAG: MFS transporter, partial [Spirochaetales bacterium]|nr:MFS transporter [Spirochaetales bacterium]
MLAVAVATRFLQWGIVGILVPVANLLRMSKGLSLAELGFSAAVMSAVVVALELPTGVLADRIGRKRTYLAAVVFQVAAYGALLFAHGFLAVSAAFGLYGVSRALSSGSLEALLIDRYIEARGQEKLHRLMSAVNAADTAGLAIGSVLGGFLPGLWASIAPASNRYHGNLLAMLFLLAVLGAITGFSVSDDRGAFKRSSTRLGMFLADSIAFARSSPALVAFLVAGTAWGVAFSAVETYWQPRLASMVGAAGTDSLNGYLSAGYFLAALVGSLAAAPLFEKMRLGPGVVLAGLRLLTAVFIAALALQQSAGGFAILYLSMFFWNGMASPPEATALNRILPADKRASMLSAVSLTVQLGGFAGAIGFGFVVGR